MTQTSGAGGEERDAGRRPLDVVFVVDCSGSMAGERIGALNWAMKTVLPAMRAHAEEHPEIAIRIRVLRFATGAMFVTPAPQPIETFAWDSLVAGGESDMGAAFHLLAAEFDASGLAADEKPPVIVLVSDGFPSDDAASGFDALFATDAGRRATRIPIAIGQDADMALLRAFSSDPSLPPLRSHDVERLVGRMRRVASGPIAAAVAGPAAMTVAAAKAAEDEDLW